MDRALELSTECIARAPGMKKKVYVGVVSALIKQVICCADPLYIPAERG